MKISFLVYNIYGIGGTVRTVVNTANYLVEKGYKVEIISIRKTFDIPKFNINKKVKLSPLYNTKRGIPGHGLKKWAGIVLKKLPSVLINKTEDLYHMFNLYTDILLYKKLKRMKTDILITTFPSLNVLSAKFVNPNIIKIGQEHAQLSVHKSSLKRNIRKYYPFLDALTVLTEREKNEYNQILGDAVIIAEIPNAISSTNYRTNYESKIIVTAGRFVYEKGFERLIRAYKPLAKQYPDWTLRIYGTGPDYDLMRREIEKNKLYNNVFLFPSTDKILNEFRKASVFVLPSRFESFGMVVIEAMSVGLPVISYNTYGPTRIITNGLDGYIVDMDDVQNLQLSLEKLMTDKKLRERMGDNALETSKSFSQEKIGELWERLFISLTKNN